MVLSCRFYGNKFPEVEDVVMVNVRSIAEMGAYVHLLEYNNIEGMILLSELSRRRIRSINKLIRVGRNECVVVIRVDKDKGLIYFMSSCLIKYFNHVCFANNKTWHNWSILQCLHCSCTFVLHRIPDISVHFLQDNCKVLHLYIKSIVLTLTYVV